jgi:hypothetical protein
VGGKTIVTSCTPADVVTVNAQHDDGRIADVVDGMEQEASIAVDEVLERARAHRKARDRLGLNQTFEAGKVLQASGSPACKT